VTAIKHNAVSLIFAHNHPSGDPTPSKSDKRFTRDLVFMGGIIEVKVLDHIIIGGNKYFRFADEGLIAKYEDNFLNLRIRGVFDSGAGHRQYLRKVSTLHTD
jgi:DNA repair protein RadC